MLRALFLATPLILAPIALAPLAVSSAAQAQSDSGNRCQQRNERARRGAGAFGGIARGALGRIGGSGIANNILPMASLLGDALMNLLDCDEQQKAATATEEAVRGGVGTTTTWSSDSRPGVTGSSTVTSQERPASDGSQCMTVTDIVIVDGEETRAPKRMCRRPPNNRYVRV